MDEGIKLAKDIGNLYALVDQLASSRVELGLFFQAAPFIHMHLKSSRASNAINIAFLE